MKKNKESPEVNKPLTLGGNGEAPFNSHDGLHGNIFWCDWKHLSVVKQRIILVLQDGAPTSYK